MHKLKYLEKYINAYLYATKKLPIKYYIDAFAGTGKCILCDEPCECEGGKRCMQCGKGKLVDGSTLIALKVINKFNAYIFIELDKNNVENLKHAIEKNVDEKLRKKVIIKTGDANNILQNFNKEIINNTYAGCLILLDPAGSELRWETINSLSRIKKADLFILYPYDMALARLAPEYKEKLNKFYGDEKWFKIYESSISPEDRKNKLLNFYINNLRRLGFKYVIYRQIRRRLREGRALYHLILATHHQAGKNIIKNIFDKELDGQKKLI